MPTPVQPIRKKLSNQRSAKITLETLEDRLAPAVINYNAATRLLSFTADAGQTDNVAVTAPAANSVQIVVAGGDTISLTGDVGAGFVLSAGNTQLDINTSLAPATDFNIDLGDQVDTLSFGLATVPSGVSNVNLQGGAGADTVTLNALTVSGNLTVDAGTITLGGIVAAGGNVSLTAVNSLLAGSVDDIADVTGAVIALNVTGAGSAIGGNASNTPLELDAATRLDATTNNGNMVLKNVAGNLPLGTLNAGSAMINLVALNGAITDANGAAINLTAAGGVTLTTTGNGSAIGTAADRIETAIGSLTATTYDGGIFVADSNGPGLIINSVTANEKGQSPFTDGSSHIVVLDPPVSPSDPPANPHAGTKAVSITAQGPVLLGYVSAPGAITITSATGGILDINQASMNVLARSVNFVSQGAAAGSAVGLAADAIEMTVESFSASTTNGGIFLAQGIDGTATSVVAGGAGNDVAVTSTGSTLRIQTITASGSAVVTNSVGSLVDGNGAAVNLTGQVVNLTGKTGIGTAADPLETSTSDLHATVSASAAGITPAASISIDNKNGGLVALNSVAATTSGGDVKVNFLGGSLSFDASTGLLSETGNAVVTFETTAGDVSLGAISAVSSITAAGAILDGGAGNVTGGAVRLKAGTGIGTAASPIHTDVATLNATTNSGGVFIREANAFTVSASAATGDIDVRNTTGNMTLGLISTTDPLAQVSLNSGGAILNGHTTAANVTANTLGLVASSGIGTGSDGLATSVSRLTAAGGTGGVFLVNGKALTLLSVTAGGAVSISAAGDLTLGSVSAIGQDVALTAFGALIDGNGATTNLSALSATLTGSTIGTSGDKIETTTATITAATTTGGIFLSNTSPTLALTATALGQAADIDIDTTGDIALNTVIAQGDTVKLRAAGSITDDNDSPTATPVNIIAKKLDIAAPGGIGTIADPLEAAVDVVVTADGGVPGTFLTFAGPLLLTESALEGAGSGTLTFDAESITIENIVDNTATIAPGRSVVLRTQTGSIVFLDSADTIETSGAGTITILAGTIAGSGGVAVLGNLKTAGGNILVQADRTITIGLLDAGAGNVTVQSFSGIIIDGNGAALNVIAGTTTLSGVGRTARENELDEEFKIAAAAAARAEAAAEQTAADALGDGQAILDAEVATQTAVVDADKIIMDQLDAEYLAQQTLVDNLSISASALNVTATIVQAAATAALLIAGPAQAIPLVGDLGTFAIQAGLQVAATIIQEASAAVGIALTVESIQLAKVGVADTTADFTYASAKDRLDLATTVQQAFAESSSITLASATKSAIVRDASERIRDQAIAARDQGSVIGTLTAPLGLQVTGVISVAAGATDSYLQVVGATALDLIQTTGSVTLISTGAISDADAGTGADILGTGLRIVAVGGIGSAADPLETRVATLNATNTAGGDVAIANTAGIPAALDITGVSNAGGGDVIISNQGNTAAGQGITVSGPISATGAGAEVTIHSGSPLTIDADVTSAGAILLEAGDTAVAGDDLTVSPGVTIQSTGSSVTLRAGDNVVVSAGSTIQASTSITITADYNDSGDATGGNVVIAGLLIAPAALIGVDPSADDDDTFTITPSAGTPITVDAEDGTDTLNFIADGLPVTILGNQITALGKAPVTFLNFEHVNIINAGGGGSITLVAGSGAADALILTGTGQNAGTFTLNGGIPISFSGVDSFTFQAGDLNDTSTVTPFATSVLPWNVAVSIDGGTGTDRIIYNNVSGLLDSTAVTATAPQAGHIDSPGVTSALNSQLVSFTNVENLTVNANPGEDEKLTVNLRDTSTPDTASLLFNAAPGADDLQLVGLFNMVIDTDHYVGLTLNGRGGDDTFNITPGPIPVFVDGGDPIGATAGDTINFNPSGAYILEPGPHNDEGGLNTISSQRVSWDHVEALSVTGGSGTVLGTNGDDAITITALNVSDFTISLNNGPAVLFLGQDAISVDALAGDDVVTVHTPGTQAVVFTPIGTDSATVDVVTLSMATTAVGVETIVCQGLAGDTLTLNGTSGNDTATINADGTGTLRSPLSPAFDFSGAGVVIFNGGAGTDSAIYNGTTQNDVINSQQTAATVVSTTVNGLTHTANDTEIISINTLAGDDLIHVGVIDALETANAAASVRFDVDAGDPNASDRLIVQDLGLGDLDILRQGPDGRSGSVTIGGFNPVAYKNVERVDITPLDPVMGGTGTDGNGRLVVFQTDPFEANDSRLNAGQLARVGQNVTSPSITPGGFATPFSTNGDEDWYEFRPTGTNTLQIKILFDKIQTLANGRAGLPGGGDLSLDIYDANGALITSGVADANGNNRTATFAATNDPAFPQFNRIFVRVKGAGAQPSLSINRYDFDNLSGAGSGIPGASMVDNNGPQVTGVNITNDPLTPVDESAYNVFDPKPAFGPTPLVPRMEVHFSDGPSRAPGFLYSAIDQHLFDGTAGHRPALGLFSVAGDLVGNVPILDVMLTNDPVVQGQPATATVSIIFDLSSPTFAGGLPDDRYTLTILDQLSDPSGSKLDGESKAAQPTTVQSFPSGNGKAGGDFVARFTVDSRPEIGTFGNGTNKTFLDLNGNGTWDPQGSGDAVHHDINIPFGLTTDTLFAGNFAATGASSANGYDKLGAYGKDNGKNRFLLDLNGDGYVDLTVFPTLSINGTPVAGDFAPNHPGQEIGIFTSGKWYLDSNGNNDIDAADLNVTNGLNGIPLVGDFDGDGKVDLATYNPSTNTFYFDLANNGYGQLDTTINFGFPTVKELAVAADMNRDGVTDVGLYVPRSDDSSETLVSDWYFLVSQGTPTAGSVSTLNHAFNQTPFSNDRFFTFGDSFYRPIVGNFDPPVAGGPTLPPPPQPLAPSPVLIGVPQFAVGSDAGGPATVTEYHPDGSVATTFTPFPATTGGVRTAVADFNGDGIPDVAAGTGPGAVARVKIFDGKTGAVLFDVRPFADFTGGVFVAAGDLTGDGKADLIITPDRSGGPRVVIYSGIHFQQIASFFGINDPSFRGGARAALGDINGDGFADLVVSAGFGGGPRISVYDGQSLARGQQVHLVPDFFLFESTLRNGAYMSVGDLDGDGFGDLVGGAGPGGGPRVLAISGKILLSSGSGAAIAHPVANFFAGSLTNRNGVRVAVKNLDGDDRADLLTGEGEGHGSRLTAYAGVDFDGGTAPELFAFDAVPGSLSGVFVG